MTGRAAPTPSSPYGSAPAWTDAVAIEAEDLCVALRYRTQEDHLIPPSELPSTSGAVWQRDGACVDVLAELFELQRECPQ